MGFIPEGMFERLAAGKTLYEYAQGPAYPIERLIDLAERAAARDARFLPELRAAPAKARLHALLRDEWADVRIVAAEGLGYHGEADASLAALKTIVKSGGPFEILAALNALEYLWRAGHVPLARVQAIVRDLKLEEPADRIPAYLLGLKR